MANTDLLTYLNKLLLLSLVFATLGMMGGDFHAFMKQLLESVGFPHGFQMKFEFVRNSLHDGLLSLPSINTLSF